MADQHSITLRRKPRSGNPEGGFFHRYFVVEKLNNWVGWLLAVVIALVFGYLIASNTTLGLGLFGVIFGVFIFCACLVNTEIGLYINLLYAFFICQFDRYIFNNQFPIGVFVDILVVTSFVSLLFRGINLKKSISDFTKNAVVKGILILVFYLVLEAFNPASGSIEGWFQSFRRLGDSILLLFVAYNVFTSYAKVKRFTTVLFVLCIITAVYACIQEWHGLFDFELTWVRSDENRFGLFYIWGNFRKFSTMGDPTAFGIAMAACAIFYMIIGMQEKRPRTKVIYFTGIIIMLLGMAFSGTRTANIMVVGGILMFVLLSLHKSSTRILAIICTMIFVVLMYGPYNNATINRFRTSFSGSKDDSYNVRVMNRASKQPYLRSHPFGGGLGTTGPSGRRFTPGHELAGFPPDSGYLRKALETGWIGLLIVCALYFTILRFGVRKYFIANNERYKMLCAACTSSIFAFYLAEFGQEAIGQITDIVIYYPMIAILLRVDQFKGFRQPATSLESLPSA
jgi:putative inorganic carbon (HCO3(-)) transporter